VGDSALTGCGTYAESTSGGVSCTGDGEAIIRVVLARRTVDILKVAADPMHACQAAVDVLTPLMPVGFMSPGHDAPALTF
jgi:beta-aspartyl-peptidase (threonine type)